MIHAPRSSPLHAVKDITVAKFFLFHTGQHEGVGVSADEESVHATLGTKVSVDTELSTPFSFADFGFVIDSERNAVRSEWP